MSISILSEKAFSLIELIISIALNTIILSVLAMLFVNNIYQKKAIKKVIKKESFQNVFNYKLGEIPDIQKQNIDLKNSFRGLWYRARRPSSHALKTLKVRLNLQSKRSWLSPRLKNPNQQFVDISINSFTFFKPQFSAVNNIYKITNAKILLSRCIPNQKKFIFRRGQTIDTGHPSLSLAYLLQKDHYYPFYRSSEKKIYCCKTDQNIPWYSCVKDTKSRFLIRTYSAIVATKNNQKYIKHIEELPSPGDLSAVWGSGFFISYFSDTVAKIYNFYQYPVCLGRTRKCPKLGLTTKTTNIKTVNTPLKTKFFSNLVNILSSPFEGGPVYLY